MSASIFQRAGDDRVESAVLAVLLRADLSLVRDLLADAGGVGDELRAVEAASATMRSAARLTAHVDWSFEVVTTRGVFEEEGPSRARVRRLAGGLRPGQWLFVLTPDPPVPTWLAEPDGVAEEARAQIVWVSFAWLATAVRDALGDPDRIVDARSHVLLAELVRLFDAEGLVHDEDPEPRHGARDHGDHGDHAVAVADAPPATSTPARPPSDGATAEESPAQEAPPEPPPRPGSLNGTSARAAGRRDTLLVTQPGAWRTYLDHAAYVCAAEERLPADVDHLAFHHAGRIMGVIPRVVRWHPRIALTPASAARLRADGHHASALTVESLVAAGRWGERPIALALLSPAGDPGTVRLPGPVDDPGTTEQRLTSLDVLRHA